MNNGQLNMVSVPTVTPFVTQESPVPVADAKDGVQHSGGGFDGLLSGIKLLAKVKPSSDSGQAGQPQPGIGKDQPALDATKGQAVDLLAQLHALPAITSASEPAAPKQEVSEKTGISTGAGLLGSEPSELASQIAMAAYLQAGRMPEVNIPTPRAVDRVQNVETVTSQSADISASVVTMQSSQTVAKPMPTSHANTHANTTVPPGFATESTLASSSQTAASDRMSEVNKPTSRAVDRQQNVASAVAQPAVISAPAVPVLVVAGQVQATHVIMPVQLVYAKESTPAATQQPVASDGTFEVNKPAPLFVDRLQNVASATAEPVQTIPAEQLTAASIKLQSELPSAHPTTPAPASLPVSEVESQLSQPQLIAARITAGPAVADNRATGLIPESRGGRQRFTTEQQIEKSRSGNETSVVKEVTASLQSAALSGESLGDSDTPRGSNSNQGQPDGTAADQMLAQQLHGQLSTDHQKVTAVTARSVPAEPVRQDVPEQVMQQVKERLVQHDVKPGNQQITLTLSPDSLGELKMNLNLQGQKLSVEIVTENRTVRDAIIQHTDTLKESLARQNITMSSFDVTTGGKGSGNQGQNQNAWRELAKQQQSWSPPRGYNIAQADLPSGQASYQRQQGQTMLDIHY